MARQRSPRFPSAPLDRALTWARQAHGCFADQIVSRSDVACSLGHVSVSGPAATKLATLRAYGLIEPVGAGLRLTADAIAAVHPQDPHARRASLRRLAQRPSLFRDLLPFKTDAERIRHHLIKLGFPSFAATQATHVFIGTCRFIEANAFAVDDAESGLPGRTHSPPAG